MNFCLLCALYQPPVLLNTFAYFMLKRICDFWNEHVKPKYKGAEFGKLEDRENKILHPLRIF